MLHVPAGEVLPGPLAALVRAFVRDHGAAAAAVMKVVIYTHPPDYVAAALAARAWRSLGVSPVLAVHRSDPLPVVEGCEVIRTAAPRRGNLNGLAFLREHLRILREHAEGEWVFKADSDTLCFRLDWCRGIEADAVGLGDVGMRAFWGFCYAVRPAFLDTLIAAADKGAPAEEEDLAIGLLTASLGRLHTYKPLTPGCPLAGFAWSVERSAEEWKGLVDAMCFQRGPERSHRAVADKMREFL